MPNRSTRRAPKKDGDDIALEVTVDGEKYVFRPAEVTTAEDRQLTIQTGGLSLAMLSDALNTGTASLFHVAAIVFLCRIHEGDLVRYQQIEETITLQSDVNMRVLDGSDESVDLPEAPAAD